MPLPYPLFNLPYHAHLCLLILLISLALIFDRTQESASRSRSLSVPRTTSFPAFSLPVGPRISAVLCGVSWSMSEQNTHPDPNLSGLFCRIYNMRLCDWLPVSLSSKQNAVDAVFCVIVASVPMEREYKDQTLSSVSLGHKDTRLKAIEGISSKGFSNGQDQVQSQALSGILLLKGLKVTNSYVCLVNCAENILATDSHSLLLLHCNKNVLQ